MYYYYYYYYYYKINNNTNKRQDNSPVCIEIDQDKFIVRCNKFTPPNHQSAITLASITEVSFIKRK